MPASYGKGSKGKATRLHSRLVREANNFKCQRCGRGRDDEVQLQCAHIISRHVIQTRTDLDNAFCLCASCHWYFGRWPIEFALFVFDKIGEDKYHELKAKAESGAKVDWDLEVERLQGVVDEGSSGVPGK